ncbi:uncharacterized protein RCH25_037962 [Pelodytes ibericus]
MGANNIKNVSDIQTDSNKDHSSSAMYKPHLSPGPSPTQDNFYTPLGSPEQTPMPMDTAPAPEDPVPSPEDPVPSPGQYREEEAWGGPFSRAMERIQRASDALGCMHSQLGVLLSPMSVAEGPRIVDSALGWEARLGDVRRDLSNGLKEMETLKDKYEALRPGDTFKAGIERGSTRESQRVSGTPGMREDFMGRVRQQESKPCQKEESTVNERLQDMVYQLRKENENLTERITELKGEVEDLILFQSDLRTAVSVAERFREEAQDKLEKAQRENRRLRGKGYNAVDWKDPSPVPEYRSLPRGVILSSLRDPILKSSSLMSVPPAEAGSASCRERRGSLETLLNESKATENLTEDSGSFFRRYGGSKRGVFLRWVQDRTCGYKHVVITNFSSSWVDGMALCALLHSYLPQNIPYTQLRPLEKRKNLQLAFQVAESIGIPALLTTDHMLQTQGPDWQKVLLYVESIYQKFEA